MSTIRVLTTPGWEEYQLLDSGDGMKLERFGNVVLARPEAEAIWRRSLPSSGWGAAAATFQTTAEEHGGHWEKHQHLPESWLIQRGSLVCTVRLSASRHVGIFPEQACQWDWITEKISSAGKMIRVLNLFGYTGLASLAAAQAGAHVTHVDASRKVIAWARENQARSGLEDKPIRWIVDDAVKFIQRESRRGNRYDAIILDPPKFGRGPRGEVWEFYKLMPELLRACQAVMSDDPLFLLLTAYAVKASSITIGNAVSETLGQLRGETISGEVGLVDQAGRTLSMAVFARWSATAT